MMKTRIWPWIALYLLLLPGVRASESVHTHPAPVRQHERAASLLARKAVTLSGEGTNTVRFAVVRTIIDSEHVLSALQQAYDSMLPEGKSPEFSITLKAPKQYLYVDADEASTIIEEVFRTSDDTSASLYLFMEGKRFFGSFEALTVIQAQAVNKQSIQWHIDVYAWPDNGLSRLVARMGLVNRYFRTQTEELTELVLKIGRYMHRNPS